MEALQLANAVGGVALAGLGVLMIVTNPGQNDYEHYATDTLTEYLKQEVCLQAPQQLGDFLRSYCKTLVDTGRPQIEQIIAKETIRRNYLLFSVYETQLSLPFPIPSYEFGTIGALQKFYTYEIQEF
ncbi:DUF4359 domain-containing protein [Cyanobacterium sp. uoEpiScrs1]|uniref:DUF4359 domain-containing protein n=1 Tax=Cyanobacterium sp. uoEpiScrs1 TaxID=2976343 RepID=UPI002269AFB1|nr:DUF4359 domain-containing protein [Cyanobacterium sp. uoEpiScrs1]